ncbi:MAG: ComEC family competence protein [Alphaproteobacteria bacterium]|nr:ComEC family competence protein [Alphaproteobacteria bacterium]
MEAQNNQEPDPGYWGRQIALYQGQAVIWAPIFLGIGAGLYFSLPQEPPLYAGLFAFLGCAALLFYVRKRQVAQAMALMLLLLALGFGAAQLRAHWVYTPMLEREKNPVRISGVVAALEDLDRQGYVRAVLEDVQMERTPPEDTPRRIRLRIRNAGELRIGQTINVLAGLNPPSGPAIPGGYDFRRDLYFEGIGAVGFVYGAPRVLSGGTIGLMEAVEDFRNRVGDRLMAIMGPREGALAQALLIGKRGGITDADNDALRNSGLYHILSISGLHIGLFSAVIFFVVRLGLALFPPIALRFPIKKIAAVAGFAAAFLYMLLAGASYPTQRSVIMTGLVYLAIMLDRFPFSLRLIAVAAFALLLLMPEAIISASFQMSFAAVLALIVVFERLRPVWQKLYQNGGWLRRAGLYVLSLALTSVVATIATAPFSLFHFQQLALYGVAANFIVVPLMGFFIMPLAVLLLVLMPLGLDAPVLQLMDWGMGVIYDTAHMVATWPHAVLWVQAWPIAALILFSVAGIMMLLMPRWHAALGILPLLAGVILCLTTRPPDVLIADDFKLVGVRSPEGALYVNTLSTDRFARGIWERALSIDKEDVHRFPREGRADDLDLTCAEGGCRLNMNGARLSIVTAARVLAQECGWAQQVIVLAPVRVPDLACDAMLLDRREGWRSGAQALWIETQAQGKPFLIRKSAQVTHGARLWRE